MRGYLAGLVFALIGFFAVAVLASEGPHDKSPALHNEAERDLARAKGAADKYQVAEAVALYTKAIDSGLLPAQQLADAYNGRGEARENHTTAYGIEDSEMLLALRDYQKARDIRPTDKAFRNEAGALIALGAYAEATAAFRKAIPFERPKPHWSLIGFARVERIQGHYDAAMRHLDEVLRMWGEDATMPIYFHRGRVLYLQEKFGAAVEAFTKGIPKQPNYPYAYQFRGCAYARLGELTKAVADMELAVKLSKEPPIDEAWEKTPYAQALHKDLATDFGVVKAMAAGAAREGERAKLCKGTWNGGEDLRTRSPLLGGGAR